MWAIAINTLICPGRGFCSCASADSFGRHSWRSKSMLPTDRPTQDHQSAGARNEGKPERIKVALVRGPSPHDTAEVQTLLRRRLLFLGMLTTAGLAFGSVGYLVRVALTAQAFAEYWLEPA